MTEIRSKSDQVEISGLSIGVVVNFIMAVAGWVAYSLTGSEALLLDGNFSFISSMTTIGAIVIIRKKHKRTETYPFGRYVFEAFFTLFKGILILGLTVAALFQNIIKIIEFLQGVPMPRLKTGPILIYMALMLVLCFGLAFVYSRKNKKIGYSSPVLSVETKSSKVDGFMTVAVGIALVGTTLVPDSGPLSFLLYIGDAIIVILMCLFLLRIPFEIIREGFVEVAAGSLRDSERTALFDETLRSLIPADLEILNRFFSKTGSSYLILAYVRSKEDAVSVSSITDFRQQIIEALASDHPNLEVEIVLRD